MPFITDTSGLSSEWYSECYTEWESNDEIGGGTSFQLLSQQYFSFYVLNPSTKILHCECSFAFSFLRLSLSYFFL